MTESETESVNYESDLEDTDSIEDNQEIDLDNITDNDFKTSLISIEEFNTFYKNYSNKNKTSSILNKYEKTKILSERAEQLSEGAIPLIPNAEKYKNVLEIAEEELKTLKIPFIIKREINNNFEYIKIKDLVLL
jgi:DNA-directed RNA polymerase subunit K/omega